MEDKDILKEELLEIFKNTSNPLVISRYRSNIGHQDVVLHEWTEEDVLKLSEEIFKTIKQQ